LGTSLEALVFIPLLATGLLVFFLIPDTEK
jgi:hypothetical protein